MPDESRYLKPTETATLVRQTLKQAFPGVPFRVKTRRYSMGSSVDVGFTDGPTIHEVRELIERFDHVESTNVDDSQNYRAAFEYNGERVRSMSSVHVSRSLSVAFQEEIAEAICARYGLRRDQLPAVVDRPGWEPSFDSHDSRYYHGSPVRDRDLGQLTRDCAEGRSGQEVVRPSTYQLTEASTPAERPTAACTSAAPDDVPVRRVMAVASAPASEPLAPAATTRASRGHLQLLE